MLCFPEDINTNILKRLPIKSLLRFKCVSKSSYKFIKSTYFVKLQLDHSLKYGEPGVVYNHAGQICCVDYDSSSSKLSNSVVLIDFPLKHTLIKFMKRILGSSNGLVCYLVVSSQKDIIIWNPYTEDHKRMTPPPPELATEIRFGSPIFRHYFGYDLKTDDYKVARIANFWGKYCDIVVYSLRLNLWKTYQNIPPSYLCEDLVLFEGILHWRRTPNDSELPRNICTFDIGTEVYKEIPVPQQIPKKGNKIDVRVLRGCLYLINNLVDTNSEVWMMKEYGVPETWTKMFTINGETSCVRGTEFLDLKQSFKNGVILVQVNILGSYLYEHVNERFTKLEINGSKIISAWPYLGSLISPNNLPSSTCYQSSEITEALRRI